MAKAVDIYTQAEVDMMLALPKFAEYEAQMYWASSRRQTGLLTADFVAHPEDPTTGITYRVEVAKNERIESFNILLQGKIDDHPMEGLCRYNVHNSMHENECANCGPPPAILPTEFHVHRYNEACVRKGHVWDSCATLLTVSGGDTFLEDTRILTETFVRNMMITFRDSVALAWIYGPGGL